MAHDTVPHEPKSWIDPSIDPKTQYRLTTVATAYTFYAPTIDAAKRVCRKQHDLKRLSPNAFAKAGGIKLERADGNYSFP